MLFVRVLPQKYLPNLSQTGLGQNHHVSVLAPLVVHIF